MTKHDALTFVEILVEELTERGMNSDEAVKVGELAGFLFEPEFGKNWLDEFKK